VYPRKYSSLRTALPGLLFVLAPLWLASAQVQPKRIVVATVDNLEITEDDLKVAGEIVQLQKQEYEVKLRALENTVALKLLERAAAKKNLSLDDFLKQEVDSKIPEPAAAEVEGYYWGQKDKFHDPFDKVRDQVAQALRRAKIQDGRQAFVQKLREQADIRVLLEPPRISIETGDAPRRGSPSAPVAIVEYSDYQCPFCKQEEQVLQQLSAKYGPRLTLVYKDYPLSDLHPQAQAAAEAAHCAGDQGKYWSYHDALFAAPVLSPEIFRKIASELQLNVEAFGTCTGTRKYKSRVEAGFVEAQQLGAKSTPSFFVNGIQLTGAQPITAFERLIDSEIESSRARSK
jgi:predicted DsbA family dithiol-disulfide isomerase